MRLTRAIFGMLLIAILLTLSAPAFAQYDPNAELPRPANPFSAVQHRNGYLIVNTDNLFLRTGDSFRYEPVGILDGGTYLIVLGTNGRTGDREWWYVQVEGYRGWVKDEFVIVRGDLRGIPIADIDGTILSPALYIGVAAPVYDLLSAAGEVVCDTPGNRFYQVLAKNATEATWFKIRAYCGGQPVEGWVYAVRELLRNPAGVAIPIMVP